MIFSVCLSELMESVANLDFTPNGVRIANEQPSLRKAKSNEAAFRIR